MIPATAARTADQINIKAKIRARPAALILPLSRGDLDLFGKAFSMQPAWVVELREPVTVEIGINNSPPPILDPFN
jgi:hypothetical protein